MSAGRNVQRRREGRQQQRTDRQQQQQPVTRARSAWKRWVPCVSPTDEERESSSTSDSTEPTIAARTTTSSPRAESEDADDQLGQVAQADWTTPVAPASTRQLTSSRMSRRVRAVNRAGCTMMAA